MKPKFKLCFLIIFIGLTSCGFKNNSSIKSEEPFNLNVRRIIESEKSQKHYISLLTDEIKYIPLQTDSLCLIQFIKEFNITKDYIIISDLKGVYQFNQSGNFVREFGHHGNGPGEHNGRIRFAVNKHQEEILIYSWGKGLINVYNLKTGVFKRSFIIDFLVESFVIMPDGDIIFFTPDFQFETKEVIITDNQGDLKEIILNTHRNKMRGNVSGVASVFCKTNHVYYMYNYRDTLYYFNNNLKRKPLAVFNLENNESHNDFLILSKPDISTYFPNYISIPHIILSDRYIFTTLQKGIYPGINQELVRSLYDKSSDSICLTEGFVNDIDGGMIFWPRWIAEDVMIDYYQPFQLLDYYNETKGKIDHSDAFIKMVSKVDENDNPVLVIIKQK